MRLYRIIVTTGTPQNIANGQEKVTVLYCGYDRLEAVRIYHESRPQDYYRGYTGPCRETKAQSKEVAETV